MAFQRRAYLGNGLLPPAVVSHLLQLLDPSGLALGEPLDIPLLYGLLDNLVHHNVLNRHILREQKQNRSTEGNSLVNKLHSAACAWRACDFIRWRSETRYNGLLRGFHMSSARRIHQRFPVPPDLHYRGMLNRLNGSGRQRQDCKLLRVKTLLEAGHGLCHQFHPGRSLAHPCLLNQRCRKSALACIARYVFT